MFRWLCLALLIFSTLTFIPNSYGALSDLGMTGFTLRSGSPPGSDVINLTLTASADTYITQGNPGQNYGSSSLIHVRSLKEGNMRLLVLFNLSMIPPGADVISANLSLYLIDASSLRTYICYRVKGPWDEGSVSWNTKPGILSTYGKSVKVGEPPRWITWDVTEHVQKFLNGIHGYAWANYGWMIQDSSEDSPTPFNATFYSRESPKEEYRPTLTLSFRPPKVDLIMDKSSTMIGKWNRITVKRISQDGVIVTIADRVVKKNWIDRGNLTVRLSSSSPNSTFSLTEGGEPVDRIVIPDGSSHVTVYYRGGDVGEHLIEASVEGYPTGYYAGDSETLLVTADTTPPAISDVKLHGTPVIGEAVKISVSVNDQESGVRRVALYYSTDGGETWIKVEMLAKGGGVYEAYIPPQELFKEVQYYIEASDFMGNIAKTSIGRFTVGIPLWIYITIFISIIAAGSIGVLILRRKRLLS